MYSCSSLPRSAGNTLGKNCKITYMHVVEKSRNSCSKNHKNSNRKNGPKALAVTEEYRNLSCYAMV